MFNRISSTYDRLNHLLSFGIDLYWRRKIARYLPCHLPCRILDCATGTADQLIVLMKKAHPHSTAVGIDPAIQMLEIGKVKVDRFSFRNRMTLMEGRADQLPLEDHSFDFISMSFGIRNVVDVVTTLKEMKRVLKPGGTLAILEFSLPLNPFVKALHLFYLRHVLPRIGKLVSHDVQAYSYLGQTIETFPCNQDFCRLLEQSGFAICEAHPLTWGIVTIYVAR